MEQTSDKLGEKDAEKVNFIRTIVSVEFLMANLFLIKREDLVKAIENTPEDLKKDTFYPILVHTLKFYDLITTENKK